MNFPEFFRLVAASALCIASLAHGQGADPALPLEKLGEEAYLRQKDAKGVVLLSVNWNRRMNCSGFDSARLRGLSFDRLAGARGDDAPGDLVVDEPMPGIVDYAFVVAPGGYALSGFDIVVAKSGRDSGGFKSRRGRLVRDGVALGGGFEVRAGEAVYIGNFSVECRSQPIPWRTYPDGPAEFQSYLGRVNARFASLEPGKVQFRPMVTTQYGRAYAAIPALQEAAAQPVAELARKAAAGDADSQFALGAAYDAGRDVPRDLAEALKWYLRAAEAGHLEAQNSVGSALQSDRRYGEALAWYEKAAAKGHARSISNLASLYDAGLGVKQDRVKASELWLQAAELGWADAMWSLGNLLRSGALGERDLDSACIWNARARRYARPFERGLLARADQAAEFFEKNLHAGELANCRQGAAGWAPKVRRN